VVLVVAGVTAAGVVGGSLLLHDRSRSDPAAAPATSSEPTVRAVAPSTSATPSATATPSPSPTSAPPNRAAGTRPDVRRLRATDRHALSVAASRASLRRGGPVPVVYLVADDALDLGWAAVPAAAARGGAVLLTRSDRLPAVTLRELQRLDPREIVVVGNRGAVSERVATAARRVAPVTRIDERDPVRAARSVNSAAFSTAATVWVADRHRTTDLAVAAAAAAARRAPLVVVDGDARSLPAADTAVLTDLAVRSATVVGGRKAVSTGVETALENVVGRGSVERADAGDGAALAARVHTLSWGGATAAAAFVADGDRPTDAFTGSFLAGHARVPLYWTRPYCLPQPTRSAVLAATVARVTILGGEGSVRSLVDDLAPCRSIDDPTSTWVLVNKRNGLSPRGFAPADLRVPAMAHAGGHELRADAAKALAAMAAASVDAGVGPIGIDTAFRSLATQDALYDTWLARRGRAWADTWYLRPGFSEHQTGLTVDLLAIGRSSCTINDCIDETPQGAWLARNSWRHGFILRYERGHTSTTGVGFEPWHFRYLGKDLARAYPDGGWHTYEEVLGRPAAPTY
jgi:LAS superfamily LD-carboxypeptidase LdcB/putative cell wall-binding protein